MTRCLYCGTSITFLQRLSRLGGGAEFCSTLHKDAYTEIQTGAIKRLMSQRVALENDGDGDDPPAPLVAAKPQPEAALKLPPVRVTERIKEPVKQAAAPPAVEPVQRALEAAPAKADEPKEKTNDLPLAPLVIKKFASRNTRFPIRHKVAPRTVQVEAALPQLTLDQAAVAAADYLAVYFAPEAAQPEQVQSSAGEPTLRLSDLTLPSESATPLDAPAPSPAGMVSLPQVNSAPISRTDADTHTMGSVSRPMDSIAEPPVTLPSQPAAVQTELVNAAAPITWAHEWIRMSAGSGMVTASGCDGLPALESTHRELHFPGTEAELPRLDCAPQERMNLTPVAGGRSTSASVYIAAAWVSLEFTAADVVLPALAEAPPEAEIRSETFPPFMLNQLIAPPVFVTAGTHAITPRAGLLPLKRGAIEERARQSSHFPPFKPVPIAALRRVSAPEFSFEALPFSHSVATAEMNPVAPC